jgi:hypothetical protein
MSSVPAHEVERRPLRSVATAETPLRTDASLRLVPGVPELFPSLLGAIRAVIGNGGRRRGVPPSGELAELGRATGARV